MFIFKDTKKRANIHAPYTSPDGTRYSRIPKELLEEIPEPQVPEDYSEDTYYRTEQDTAPYVIYTKKSDEQILAIRKQKVNQKREQLWHEGGCLVQGKWFHTDAYSKQQQMALTMLGSQLPEGLLWKTMDGTFIEMTPTLAQELFAAQIQRDTEIFAIAETKINDISEIDEGWPNIYTPEEEEVDQ
jgi:hypothetical protein